MNTRTIELTEKETHELITSINGLLVTLNRFLNSDMAKKFGNEEKQKEAIREKIEIFENIKRKLK